MRMIGIMCMAVMRIKSTKDDRKMSLLLLKSCMKVYTFDSGSCGMGSSRRVCAEYRRRVGPPCENAFSGCSCCSEDRLRK